MAKRKGSTQEKKDDTIAVDKVVIVFPGTSDETRGVVIEDFGDMAGKPVDIGDQHVADPARRWAVSLDDGRLVFVDSDNLTVA
ncbi:hypothetical protein [Mycobacterium hubeiense]|uniref:hypothetical protein n=1 Tax=Mycobacterium hubeiense TaxID=1867256 RepID=UPI000C7EF2DD|nr:hypothetical protein [Mycobacterium sp. QGD 101]